MKKKLLFTLILFSIFTIIFQGCLEESKNSEEKLVNVSLNTLGFKIDELPDGLPLIYEGLNETEITVNLSSVESVIILERYNAGWGSNASLPSLMILMTKYDSIKSAIAVFSEYNITFFDNESSSEVYLRLPVEKIGEESAVGILTSGEYSGAHQIIFRISNVVTRFYTDADIKQKESIYYAKILENHFK